MSTQWRVTYWSCHHVTTIAKTGQAFLVFVTKQDKMRVHIGIDFTWWETIHKGVGFKTDADIATFLLDR